MASKKAAKKAPAKKAAKPPAKKGKESPGRPVVAGETLAKLCNLTVRRVQQLAVDGILVRRAAGKYDLWGSVAGYIRFLQDKEVNQWGSDSPDINGVRKRKLELECKRISFALEVDQGKYVERAKVVGEGVRVGTVLRTLFMRFENDLPPMLEGLAAPKMKVHLRSYARRELVDLERSLKEAAEQKEERHEVAGDGDC